MVFENAPLISHTVQAAASPANWWPIGISAVSVVLAALALSVTFAKYRLDLYDRRWAVYQAALQVYQASVLSDAAELNPMMRPFITKVRESQYLFPESSHIYDRLMQVFEEIFKVKVLADERAKPAGERNQDLINHLWKRSIGEGVHGTLDLLLQDLELRLRPYLTYRIFDVIFWRYWWNSKRPTPIAPLKVKL